MHSKTFSLSSLDTVKQANIDDLVESNKIAVIHEWLSTKAGSEQVTRRIIELLKYKVEVFATVDFMSKKDRESIFGNLIPKTSFIQKLPIARRHFRYYLPIFPFAVRSHDLKDYDVLISSSHAFAHGIKKRKGQIHISYCHTPMRYIWDMRDLYLKANNLDKGILSVGSNLLSNIFRAWDSRVSKNVDYYISNSKFTASRIKRFYGRKAKVIYPPVNVDRFELGEKREDYYFTASRLVCYKKVDLIVEAFSKMPEKKLVIVGDGSDKEKIEKMATPNVKVLSHLKFDDFHRYLRRARGFIFAGKEDFGITMVEAQACGTPLIAYGKGGASEIVKPNKTGVLFKEQTVDSLTKAVIDFEENHEHKLSHVEIKENANRFSISRFNEEMSSFINQCVNEKSGS
ncbi:glycosyltransferase [Salibacter halophilus]|uniref:Glycosyltransferase family 4 protein n=1 Tax=Salibacter halophilus TaxID=1803916 RepID=A0A6N6M7R2_9FLAO|nr:glycosyltransferase [Salibacter halophilus]KAB1063973.1 glycosyltransferase family 4 protein [Salibacter halophilus]